jgi:hypothetical protein
MIVDLRTYTMKPGSLAKYLDVYQTLGWPLQTKHLPKCIGYYIVEIGVQHRVVHLWEYADITERAQRRAQMEADPGWPVYRNAAGPLFVAQDSRIMAPAPFWSAIPVRYTGPYSVVDVRTYFLQPGRLGDFAKIYREEGMAIQTSHLGRCLGFYVSDIGPLHQIVHLWAYADLNDRQKRRAALAADPKWTAYFEKAALLFTHQENEIVRPAPFWTPT